MSQYQPPPLDSYDPHSAGAKRPSFAPAPAPTTQHQPLLNPFGSPHSPPPSSLRTEGASLDGLDGLVARQKLRTDDRPVVAFISGIASEIDDSRFLEILQVCGKVNSWRRAFDSDDKPLTFGFCEFKSLEGVVRALNILPRAAWTSQGECVRSSPRPKSLTVTVDRTMQRVLDNHISEAGHIPGADKASEQAVLDAVTRIIQEPRALSEAGADIRLVDMESTETGAEPVVDDSTGHTLDRNAEFNLDTLTITKEIARHRLGSPEEGRPQESPEQQQQQQLFSLSSEEDWEREQTLLYRTRRYILAANDRESRLGKDLEERERRAENAALRELDRVEEMQRSRDSMSATLSKWDDSEEERLREHEYYRDRERWWHHRKAVRARELELDAIDQQEQTLDRKIKSSSLPTNARGPEPADIDQGQSNAEDAARPAREGCLTSQAASKASKFTASVVDTLFAQPIKWDCVDEGFLRAKIEPAARGLLQEYIGEDADQEATDLAEFVISHIRDRKSPQSLVEELEIVLVEEALSFVGQLWCILPSDNSKQR